MNGFDEMDNGIIHDIDGAKQKYLMARQKLSMGQFFPPQQIPIYYQKPPMPSKKVNKQHPLTVYTNNKNYNYTNDKVLKGRNSFGASLDGKTKMSDLTNPFKKWKP